MLRLTTMMAVKTEGSDESREAWSLEAQRLAHGLDANMAVVLAHLKRERERNRVMSTGKGRGFHEHDTLLVRRKF